LKKSGFFLKVFPEAFSAENPGRKDNFCAGKTPFVKNNSAKKVEKSRKESKIIM
jgi:hypothetical protein